MIALEERYRSVLRLLPPAYRELWEEDMVATFLETMATDDPDEAEYLARFGRPNAAEVASVVCLAARLRLGGVDAPPRAFAWGESVRVVALVGLLTTSVLGAAVIGTWLWEAGRIRGLPTPSSALGAAPLPSPWGVVLNLTFLAWAGAYLSVVFGHRRLGQALGVLGIAPLLTEAVGSTASSLLAGRSPGHLLPLWCLLLVNVFLVGALAAFHREAPAVEPRPWLLAAGVGMALVPVVATLGVAQPFDFSGTLTDWAGLCSAAVVAAIAVHALRGTTMRWSLALSLLAGSVLVLRLATLLDYVWNGSFTWGSSAVTLGLVQAVAVLAAGWWVAAVASRTFGDLPGVVTTTT